MALDLHLHLYFFLAWRWNELGMRHGSRRRFGFTTKIELTDVGILCSNM